MLSPNLLRAADILKFLYLLIIDNSSQRLIPFDPDRLVGILIATIFAERTLSGFKQMSLT
jgi:hypothetical protein